MVQMTIPITANIATMATKMITANILMASAFSHPQSKKCFTKASQIISWIMAAIIPVKKAPKNVPITVPMMTIQIASVNFAFSFPTSARPDSQRIGEIMMVFMTMLMTSESKLIGINLPPTFGINYRIIFILLARDAFTFILLPGRGVFFRRL